ncbi:hypothetical protein JCM19379_02080 [Methyloparacoccus murrellii]
MPKHSGLRCVWTIIPAILAGCVAGTPDVRTSVHFDGNPEASAGLATSREDLPQLLQKARLARKEHRDDEALYLFVRALERDPLNAEALQATGDLHREKGNRELAEVAYRMLIKRNPRDPAAQEGLGLCQLNDRDSAGALAAFRAAIAADPRRWPSHNALGLLSDRDGRHAEAQGYYQQALRIHPDDAGILTNLGYSRYLAGNWPGAMQAYEQALKIDPAHEGAWLNKGLLLARQRDDKGALAAFRQVMDEADAYNDLGYIYMTQGEPDTAHEYFEKAIRTSPAYHTLANENLRRLLSGELPHSD